MILHKLVNFGEDCFVAVLRGSGQICMAGPPGRVLLKGVESARMPVLDRAGVLSLAVAILNGGAKNGRHCLMVTGSRIGVGRTPCGCQCMPDGIKDEDHIQAYSFASGEQGGVHIRCGATGWVH